MSIKLPEWLNAVPPEKRARARKTYLLKLAALQIVPSGTLGDLSVALGLSRNTLGTVCGQDGHISPRITLAIESAVGRDLLPRELLNPEVYPATE